MKRTPMPSLAMPRMISSRLAASSSVRTAVGSSNTTTRLSSLPISRAISTNCMWPTGSPATGIHSSMESPARSRLRLASAPRRFMSKRSSFPPVIRITGSRFSITFSATESPGSSMNSWWTMPMPLAMASWGPAKSTWRPASRICPE